MNIKLLYSVAMAAAALAAAPASAQVVTSYNTSGSTFACNGLSGCTGDGTAALSIGGMTLTFGSAFGGPITTPSNITLGTITASGDGNATLDGITLDLLVNSVPGGSGGLPGGDIIGTLTGTSANASISWSAGGVQLGDFLYTVSNSPLSLVAPSSGGITTIQGHVAGVPEPATWGMMLIGFGAMGVAIRRRRRPVLAQVA